MMYDIYDPFANETCIPVYIYLSLTLLEVKHPCDPVCPSVGRCVGRSVGVSVKISWALVFFILEQYKNLLRQSEKGNTIDFIVVVPFFGMRWCLDLNSIWSKLFLLLRSFYRSEGKIKKVLWKEHGSELGNHNRPTDQPTDDGQRDRQFYLIIIVIVKYLQGKRYYRDL